MEFEKLLKSAGKDLDRALAQKDQIRATIADSAEVIIERASNGDYAADLRVKGATVAVVREEDHGRFIQQLKEQIATHVSRDQQPDLTGP